MRAKHTAFSSIVVQVKKECDHLEKAEIGNPKTPLARSPYLSDKVVREINEGIGCVPDPFANLSTKTCAFCKFVLSACKRYDLHVMPWAQCVANQPTMILMCRFKYHSAMIFDSAAAFFGRDNVALPGVAHFFKVTFGHFLVALLDSKFGSYFQGWGK